MTINTRFWWDLVLFFDSFVVLFCGLMALMMIGVPDEEKFVDLDKKDMPDVLDDLDYDYKFSTILNLKSNENTLRGYLTDKKNALQLKYLGRIS